MRGKLVQSENSIRVRKASREQGLSVIELLLGITAIGIVILLTVPFAPGVMGKYQLWRVSSDLATGLELARTEAIKRSSIVRVCPSSNGISCRRSGGWDNGWLVFSDGNANGTAQEIEFIRAFKAPNKSISIVGDGAVQSMASFNPLGLVPDKGSNDGEFWICTQHSDKDSRILVVDVEGWTQITPGTNKICETG